jgi:hypothetical protein
MAMRLIVIVACCLVPHVAMAQRTDQPVLAVRVVGPLPVSADSYPFGAADHARVPEDLQKVGYVEEEFLVSGVANVRLTGRASAAMPSSSRSTPRTGSIRTSAGPSPTRSSFAMAMHGWVSRT